MRPRLLSKGYGAIVFGDSVMVSDGMTSSSVTNIRTRMHPTHLQYTQLPWIDCLEPFQDTELWLQRNTPHNVDILSLILDIKSELVYPPTPSFDPSPKINNKSLIFLKYLRMLLQQSSTFSMDTTDIYSWYSQHWLYQFEYITWHTSMLKRVADPSLKFLCWIFSASTLYILFVKIQTFNCIYLYRSLYSQNIGCLL